MNRIKQQREILAGILADAGYPDARITQYPRFIIVDPGQPSAPNWADTLDGSPAHGLAPFAILAVDVRAWIAAELTPEGVRIPVPLPTKLEHQETYIAANPIYAERTATRALREYLEATMG